MRGKQLDQPYVSEVFTFVTASPLDFGVLYAGDEIVEAQLIIEVPFDDPAAVVTLGLQSATGVLLSSGDIDPTVVGTYSTEAARNVVAADAVRVQVVPGASTQGSGRVVVSVRRK